MGQSNRMNLGTKAVVQIPGNKEAYFLFTKAQYAFLCMLSRRSKCEKQ